MTDEIHRAASPETGTAEALLSAIEIYELRRTAGIICDLTEAARASNPLSPKQPFPGFTAEISNAGVVLISHQDADFESTLEIERDSISDEQPSTRDTLKLRFVRILHDQAIQQQFHLTLGEDPLQDQRASKFEQSLLNYPGSPGSEMKRSDKQPTAKTVGNAMQASLTDILSAQRLPRQNAVRKTVGQWIGALTHKGRKPASE